MSEYLYIDEQSFANLNKRFKVLDKRVRKASTEGLVKFGMLIIAKAQEILKKNGSIATNVLRIKSIFFPNINQKLTLFYKKKDAKLRLFLKQI
jgi:hypothetical protein